MMRALTVNHASVSDSCEIKKESQAEPPLRRAKTGNEHPFTSPHARPRNPLCQLPLPRCHGRSSIVTLRVTRARQALTAKMSPHDHMCSVACPPLLSRMPPLVPLIRVLQPPPPPRPTVHLLPGDSLTQYMSVTLAAVLRAEVIESETKPFSNYFSACGGELRYAAVRNDFLDTRTTHFDGVRCEQPDISDSHCTVFAKDSILAEFDTLVVNSGAHRMGGGLEAFRTRMNKASEELTASMKRLHGDDAILVVRNTTPGHWGCGRRWVNGGYERQVGSSASTSAGYRVAAAFVWKVSRPKRLKIHESLYRLYLER